MAAIERGSVGERAGAGLWPGALVGQQFFRHKTRKTSFQVAFWFYVILNLAVLGWLLVWPDAEFARQALDIKPVILIGR